MPGVANPLHFGNDSGVTSPLKPAPKKLPLPNAAVPPDSANPLRAEDNSGVTIPVWRPSPKKPPAPAAAAMAQARCRTRLFFAAGLLLGALLGAVSVGSFLPRLLDVVTIRGEPLPFPLPLFFRNLTPPERGSWSYTRYPDDGKGPGTWGTLRDPASGALRYPLCADRSQSPIALSAAGATPRGTGTQLHRTAKGARNFTMTPRAEYEGWEFTLRDGAAPPKWLVDGDVYEFQEFHYHSPSEHTLEGVQHALELHFLFELPGPEEPPQRAVMAILFPWASNNPDNPFVSSFWNNIYYREPRAVTSEVDLAGMMDAVQPFMYRYSGALTTPPCTPVKWFVAIATQGISTQEWAEFAVSNGLVENARPLQPLNGRTVERYELGSPISVPII